MDSRNSGVSFGQYMRFPKWADFSMAEDLTFYNQGRFWKRGA
jgi:hypothetical protein